MKNYQRTYRIIVSIILIIFIICCSKDKDAIAEKGEGTLKLNVNTLEKDKMVIETLRSVPLNRYHVTIFTSEHDVYIEYGNYEDLPESITLAVGDYYVVAHSDNDSTAAFENPYLYGESPVFSIGGGRVSTVDVTCSVANCAVSVTYSDQVADNFSDYHTVVKNDLDSLIYMDGETRTGYFHLAGLTVYSILTYELSGGGTAQKRIEGEIPSPQAGNIYNITIDASFGNMNTGIRVSLDESLDPVQMEFNDYLDVNGLGRGDLLITEIMYDPTALSDTEGEWFEIFNNAPSSVNLQNLVLQSESSTDIVDEKIILNPGGYYVMARTDTAYDGTKFIYGNITLTNTADGLSLYTYGTDGTDGSVIYTVSYDESLGFPPGAGASINLCTRHYDFDEAQLGTSWCLSTDTFYTGDYGTPGSVNISCD